MDRRPNIIEIDGSRYFQKHTSKQRFMIATELFSVLILAITGLPLRYSDESWAPVIYSFLGGPNVVPNLHRAAGVLLIMVFIWHTAYWIRLFFKNNLSQLRKEKKLTPNNIIKSFLSQSMMMNKKDLRDIIDHFKYILFITNKPAQHGRFVWKEKVQYYAQYYGITLISVAGVMLWWRDEVSQVLPGIVLNVAYLAHSYEALLALLFLFFITWYNEFYCPEKFPIPSGFFSGYISEPQMIHEHNQLYIKYMNEAGLENEIVSHHDH